MSKLKNIQTVQKLLDGSSRWQTRKTFNFAPNEKLKEQTKEREEGEIWEEHIGENTYWWRMENGIKVRYGVHPNTSDLFQKIRQESRMFANCPKEQCTCVKPTHLDLKFKKKMEMCSDCVIEHETALKIRGQFHDYALDKMRRNAQAFFAQADQEVIEIKKAFQNDVSFVDENGEVEKWEVDGKEKLLERIDSEYDRFKTQVMNKFEKPKE
jgi:hypothetical protein